MHWSRNRMSKANHTWCSILVSLMTIPLTSVQADQTHSFEEGWNLIAIQVEPTDPSPHAVFGKPAIKSVWALDNATKRWTSYHNPDFDAAVASKNAIPGAGLADVAFGRAYWVETSAPTTLTVIGTTPAVAPPVAMGTGWNLIGLPVADPGGGASLSEPIPILGALALQGLDFDLLLKWQEGASLPPGADAESVNYNRSQFGTSVEGTTNLEEFRFLDPDRGYWIRVTDPEVLQPQLLTTVRGEADLPPTGNFPNGPEDVVLQGGATPVLANAQTHIVFFPEEDVQRLSFSNEGGGVMLWSATWSSTDTTLEEAEAVTLSLSPSADDGENTLSGVTTTETEAIFLRVDRKNLNKANSPYTGTLALSTSAGEVTFSVSVEVGGLKGEWSGSAEITSVNGKRNPVPDIDLNLSFFEDIDTAGLLRGGIDSSQSVLWPVDVQLIGHITGMNGNGFQLGGAFVLPPGDQNNEPFDVWDASSSGHDIDWNDDGFNSVDRINPFPFPIYRSVVLEGKLVSANAIDDQGYVIEGTYREVIYGMMREPIQMEGRFTLNRESPVPFDSLRETVVSGGGGMTSPIATGPIPGRRIIPNGSALPAVSPIPINADLVLEEVRVSFTIKNNSGADLPTTAINIVLEAPDGSMLTLHDGSAIDPTSLIGASYPNPLTPLGTSPSYDDFVSNITTTAGNWQLHVTNNSVATIDVSTVKIVLIGQPVMDVFGKALDDNGQPVVGADVALNGLPISQVLTGVTGADGSFQLQGLPAMPLNLAAFHPAYTGGRSIDVSQLTPAFAGAIGANPAEMRAAARFAGQPLPAAPPADLGVPGFGDHGSSAASPFLLELEMEPGPVEISAFPYYGSAPLEVAFYAVRANTGGSIDWDFGDGDDSSGSGVAVNYTFEDPGVYEVELTHSTGTLTHEIIVQPSPAHTPANPEAVPDPQATADKYKDADDYNAFIFQPQFHGGGSLPVSFPAPSAVEPAPDYPTASPSADLVMVQHTYAASADIDLAPHTSGPGSTYDSDAFQSGPNYWGSALNNQPGPGNTLTGIPEEGLTPPHNDPGWTYEDHNYVLWGAKWFDDTNLNGNLDPGEDDIAGLTGYKYDSGGDNDTTYEDPRPTGLPNDASFTYYRMACNIGATISPVGTSGASVRRADADPVISPTLVEGDGNAGIAGNLKFTLTTNLLAGPPE